MAYALVSPSSPAQWRAYHDVRRVVLFERRGRFGAYDHNHPDEFRANHFPKLLFFDEQPVGVIRIDVVQDVAWFRRVAIKEDHQRIGHGRMLLELSERFAHDRGARRIQSSVAADAVEFYRRCGYLTSAARRDSGSVMMFKDLVR